MRTVHKFTLRIESGKQIVLMPRLSDVRHVAMQNDVLCLWATVNTELPMEEVGFCVIGTGHSLPESISIHSHVGTALDGEFIWHVFQGAP